MFWASSERMAVRWAKLQLMHYSASLQVLQKQISSANHHRSPPWYYVGTCLSTYIQRVVCTIEIPLQGKLYPYNQIIISRSLNPINLSRQLFACKSYERYSLLFFWLSSDFTDETLKRRSNRKGKNWGNLKPFVLSRTQS